MDIDIKKTNKIDIDIKYNNKQEIELNGVTKILENDHKKLENLDYENSGHTGFQPAGNYLTKESDPTVPDHVKNIKLSDIENWNNKSDFSGNYDDLNNKPTIPTVPTNISAFTNDKGYITKDVSVLDNYYNKNYIDTLIGNVETVLTILTTGAGE